MTDIAAIAAHHFPGIVVQRSLTDAIALWLAEHGAVSDDDVPSILALANGILAAAPAAPLLPTSQPAYDLSPLPPYPTGMPRWLHSNSSSDGWSILDAEKEALGGGP